MFVFTSKIHAQLFVKGNTYIYNKSSYVYVKEDIELEANSHFYLRNEGQLLQGGTTLNGVNKGTGELSVFQEGTVNNYAFNYWCSPIGNVAATSTGNRDFGITLLGVPTNNPTPTIGFNPTSITTSSYNGFSSTGALTIASYWIYTYHTPSTFYTGWTQSGATTDILAGRGFTMKGVWGDDTTDVGEATVNNPSGTTGINDYQRYDFRGKPNDGNILINVEGDKLTLTGNPYPSAIDLNQFFDDNSTLDGKAYYWVQDKTINSHNITSYSGGYATYNFADPDVIAVSGSDSGYIFTAAIFTNFDLGGNAINLPIPPAGTFEDKGRFAPIGQGFVVKGAPGVPAGSTATMKNSYRVFVKEGELNDSVFQKNITTTTADDFGFYSEIPNVAGIDFTQVSKAPPPYIKINSTLNGSAVRQVAIGFRNGSVDGVDRADAKLADIGLPIDVYMVLENAEYIHSITTFNIDKRFPIGFKNNGQATASYKVQVYEFVNFDTTENVYLYDGVTGLYHNIKNNYYEVTLPPGVYNDRFEITFKNEEALGLETNISDSFVIVQNNQNQQLAISNPTLLDVKSVALYDIGGKVIFTKINLGSQANYEFSTASLSEGVYVVKLQTMDDKSTAQKIIVKRK